MYVLRDYEIMPKTIWIYFKHDTRIKINKKLHWTVKDIKKYYQIFSGTLNKITYQQKYPLRLKRI